MDCEPSTAGNYKDMATKTLGEPSANGPNPWLASGRAIPRVKMIRRVLKRTIRFEM